MNKAKQKVNVRLALAGALVTGAIGLADAGVIHVAPELPEGSDGSGSSWANAMADIPAACAAAKGNGDEVWMKTGVYPLVSTTSLYSGLKVIGGFAGLDSETSAADANPVANPTIITNDKDGSGKWYYKDKNSTWIYSQVPVREGLTINMPPDDLRPEGVFQMIIGSYNPVLSCFADSSGSLADVVISGLTFCTITIQPIDIGLGSEVEISKCRFVACNCYQSTTGAAIKSKGVLNVHDSDFIGCNCAILQDNAPAGSESVVSNCTFMSCSRRNDSNNRSGIHFWVPAARLRMSHCTFKTCREVGYFGVAAGSIMEDCVVEDCRWSSYYYNVDIARCVFRNNTLDFGAVSALSYAIVDLNGNTLTVSDTLFERNRSIGELAETATAQTMLASCATIVQNTDHPVFLNCSFVSNEVVTTSKSDLLKTGTILLQGNEGSRSVAMINCTFRDNLGAPELCCFKKTGSGHPEQISVAVVNSIFRGADSSSYVPFEIETDIMPGIYNCNIMNFDPSKITTDAMVPTTGVTTEDTEFGAIKVGENGVYAQTLCANTPFRKAGRPFWTSADGRYWIHDPNVTIVAARWRNLRNVRAWVFDNTLPEISTTIPADAFGRERVEKSVALGPANPDPLGMMILLR